MPPVASVTATPWTQNALTVLKRRYLRKDSSGRICETPDELLRRVARAVAAAEARYGGVPETVEAQFFDSLQRLELLPNSPTLMNAGRELGQLSACFVLPVGDSLPEIFDAVKWAAIIQQTGGGTGFAFSRLRPSGDSVSTTHGAASGPVSFIEVFNTATDAIRQGGVRRGANMGILRVDHPDVLEFVSAKADLRRLRNFNLSVAITDEFMRAVEEGREYALKNPRDRTDVRRLDARRVWELIARLAWKSGEPGVIFIDRINALNPTPALGEMESTNPCGELPLLPFESCNLASVDVGKFVSGDRFDWERLGRCVRLGVRFLDDVIDANRYPLPQIEAITHGNRKIGLGVMGFADALVRLDVAYDSERAVAIGGELAAFVEREAQAASEELARERGAFPNWAGSRWQQQGRKELRNATTTTIAPTGTISILAGCSGGIEPLYAVSFVRQVLDGERLVDVHPLFVERARREGWYSEALMQRIAERGSVRGMAEVPEAAQRVFATAYDVAPAWHIRMQAAFQAHVHNAVSKTINFPRAATVEDVQAAYADAYRLGCKGVTVYRDGSREEQVLSFGLQGSAADVDGTPCPECGAPLPPVQQGACTVCLECGYSRCL
ncbi:MAG TPA: adenosylcobalamin-dependent ribonucleoside-diphosphate reductase [Polyangia bacterium]|nr:adenosylcobalamin-dependent ribonucleoside-diphosphate reductase [Polyangia bacterium]